ncbi:transcriptional regulator with XRE-family HTH domain [Anaerobacterium chartisolvens]|uniref:Transcriptional regulator with XRE-family HTH domain n=1 Tax=Anaerobacterium chartisolvens TaxID=1297424 RepID=A0A369AP36_9FIRM|nr:helix-turn-helix transcriptional regulator [Anaerobacterium chartisolvens]RCX09957.1 transcriptional regulator with XRE-family HTH domain [Anaerobacterium chartisolvens]
MEITLGKRIKQLVGEKKVRQQQIAAELGINASTLSSYVIDYREPPIEKLKKMAEYFDVSIDYLTGYTQSRSPYPPHLSDEAIAFIKDPQNQMYLKLAMDMKGIIISTASQKEAFNSEKLVSNE